jgi:hypothetical protein
MYAIEATMTTAIPVVAGRVLIGLVAAFLLVASVGPKLGGAAVATEALVALGWPARHAMLIGVVELVCVVLYVVPRTRLLGAALTTALLGGAIATHLRAGSPLFTHTLFGVYLGVLVWSAMLLADPALRRVFPIRRG